MTNVSGLIILENKRRCVCGRIPNQKRPRKSSKMADCRFLPLIFSNIGHLECYIPLNSMCGVFSS